MIVTKELEMTIANEMQSIKSVDVIYINGKIVSGFISTAIFAPLEIILCKHQVVKGENLYHNLDFSHIQTINIQYHNGLNKTFE